MSQLTKLGNSDRVLARAVAHLHALLSRILAVNGVDTRAGADDHLQLGGRCINVHGLNCRTKAEQ